MERNLTGELNMYKEAGIKPNFSDIARRYGLNRHTVASYWEADGRDPGDGRSGRGSAFDPHLGEIVEKAALPGVTKAGIYELLVHKYPDEGLPGYNALTAFMRRHGVEVGAGAAREPHPRFETPPGLQLQFDWKESLSLADRSGEVFGFNVFAATLSWSRRHVFVYSRTRTTDDLLRCMYVTICRLGGVASEWLTDNMSALVVVSGGRRTRVERVFSFARDAGFEIRLARPRTPQTKGKVESSNRFLNRLRAFQGEFDGEAGLAEVVSLVERSCNSEPNGTTGVPPSVLFMREKDALRPAGNMALLQESLGDVVEVRSVPPTMLVSAHGRSMSVPRRCIGRPARVVTMPDGSMDRCVGGELAAHHAAGAPAYDPAHYAEALEGKRWFGDADIAEAAEANLRLLDSVWGAL